MQAGTRRPLSVALIALASLVFAAPLAAAPAGVPGSLSYQGVLLDDLGAPQTGPVDLVVRIYDQAGGGTLLYKQEFLGTALADGTFSLVVGPAGAATDVPSDPLTTSLADVFSGDLVSGADRFFELTVAGDPALGRIQILSAPLAIRAASAANADTADSATSAQSVVAINGVDPLFVSEIFEHFNFDNSDPPNDDPREGVGDTDGDGLANFIDPDNDGDGLSDLAELNGGSDINLITPTITGLNPGQAVTTDTLTVTIDGTNFEPGMSVSFGTENPVPTNVTATSLDVVVGPQPVGPAAVTVQRLNGESDDANFTWNEIVGIPYTVSSVRLETFAVRTIETLVGQADDNYQVSNNGNPIPNFLVSVNGIGKSDWTFGPAENLRGVKCVASGTNCNVFENSDSGNDDLAETQFAIETINASTQASLLSADISINGSDDRVISYVRGRQDASLEADVVVARDYNGDNDWADGNELIVLEAGLADATVHSAITSTGTPVVMWDRDAAGSGDVSLAVDLNGDGDFADNVGGNDETRAIAGPGVDCYDVTVDGSDRIAMVYQVTGNPGITFQHDRNGDDDFDDAGETQNFSDGAASLCAITPSGATGIALAYDNGTVSIRNDENDDGDFDDPTEALSVTSGVAQLNLATDPTGQPVLITESEIFNSL